MTIKWSYALNQWKGGHDRFVTRREHERALKTVSIAGFSGVEIASGTGRWDPLARKDTLEQHYGSVAAFRDFLHACGIDAVSSYYYDPGLRIIEEGAPMGRSILNGMDHDGIVDSLRQYADLLTAFGGNCIVVRAMPAWSKDRPLSPEAIALASACWNKAGAMAAERGVRLALNIDATSMLRTADDVAALLDACEPAVGLSIDTAEAVIAGMDPLALYRQFAGRVRHIQFKDAKVTDTLDEYRLPNPDHAMMLSGGTRQIERWFWEMGTDGGLVDFPALHQALIESGYDGWVVVESDQSPNPPTSALLNGWYLKHVLKVGEPASA